MIRIVPTDANGLPVTALTQWDRGVTLQLSHSLLTEAQPVHFQNDSSDEAIVMESAFADGVLSVEVPDTLLEEAEPITGFVCLTDDSSARSILTFSLTVQARAQPADLISTNSDTYVTVESVLSRLNSYGETTVTVQVGSVTTGEAGSGAAVTNSGSETAVVLDFVIPRGDTGEQGEAGAQGEAGKSAYDYAAEAGYAGSEDDFAAALQTLAELLTAEEAEY